MRLSRKIDSIPDAVLNQYGELGSGTLGPLVNVDALSNFARMRRGQSGIVVTPYKHINEVFERTAVSHAISILGRHSDRLEWPDVGTRKVLRLEFDDTIYSSGRFVAPSRDQIAELIEFTRSWNGDGTLMVHCRAGSSRSPAAAMIAVAALGRQDGAALVLRIRMAKAYFRPNESMLGLADSLLFPSPGLVDLARSIPAPTRIDPWGPVWIPLGAPTTS